MVADPFSIPPGEGLAVVQRGRPAQYGVTQVELVDQDLAGGLDLGGDQAGRSNTVASSRQVLETT